MRISQIASFCFLFLLSCQYSYAQTQKDFTDGLTNIYQSSSEPNKALRQAKDLYKMVQENQKLQTYANYYMLYQIFLTQAANSEYAQKCKELADKVLADQTGNPVMEVLMQWNNVYFPALFNTTNPQNAQRALSFLNQNPTLQSFNNYTFVAYGFERASDYSKAKKIYEQALLFGKDDSQEFHSYSYYTNFLSHSGDYLKAEEYIRKMEKLAESAIDMLQISYRSEMYNSKSVYYLAIGDYQSYIKASDEQYAFYGKSFKNPNNCDPFSSVRYNFKAFASEMLKEYREAQVLWEKRDSSNNAWIDCHNRLYPTTKQYRLSMLPIFLMKTGNKSALQQPLSYYITETEAHYNSYKQYAQLNINLQKAKQLAFLTAPQYHEAYKPNLEKIKTTRDFSESTSPFADYAYFNMRDRKIQESKETYDELFKLNVSWINDVLFSFGEKAFVTYYNSRLKEGYDNYHSFVKISKSKYPNIYPTLAEQAYNNLLFTKSISLKGVQKRKQAFINVNDPATVKTYEDWLTKKEELIRHYRKTEDPTVDTLNTVNQQQLKKLQEEVNHLENELAVKSKGFKTYLQLESPNWKDIRSKLKEGEAAVEITKFQWRDQLYYNDTIYYAAYIVTKNSQYPEVVYLSDLAPDLDNKYYKLYKNSVRYKQEDKESYQHYWAPIQEQLKGIRKVYFSPDGIYNLINLPTIKNPKSGKYLLDELDIHYTTSSNDIGDTEQKEIKTATLFGRPSYKLEKTPIAMVSAEPDNTRSFVMNFRGSNIADLPGTEEEALSIKKELDKQGITSNIYLKDQATEDKLYTLKSPDILHIATHGYWSDAGTTATDGYRMFNAMANSGLLMAGVLNYYSAPDYADTYDGILTAYEAQTLNLDNTSLVVLSACETSLGEMDAGEGVYGLQRAFRAAGAKSIMTSLWKVDDKATKDFMILFYQNLLITKNKHEAFKAAQKTLKTKYPEPYYWGAFVLMGM